jgi:hypothetical protein
MGMVEDVRAHFAGFAFGLPCAEADIDRAEAVLGEKLPLGLRELYAAFNGFRGPTNAAFFWPLFATLPSDAGLVEMNTFFRGDDVFPQDLVSQCLFFGDDGIGAQWAIARHVPGKVIKWDARWGREFEISGDSPLDAWLAEREIYDRLAEHP